MDNFKERASRPFLYLGELFAVEKVAVFIDGGYFSKITDTFGRPKIDFQKVAEVLTAENRHFRTYYYNCPPYQSEPPTDAQRQQKSNADRFYDALRSLPRFEVRLGKLVYRGTGSDGKPILLQKQADLLLAVDLVLLTATGQISQAILIAGDSDFIPAVRVARDRGCSVTLVHGPVNTYHRDLWRECDERLEIDQALVTRISLDPRP